MAVKSPFKTALRTPSKALPIKSSSRLGEKARKDKKQKRGKRVVGKMKGIKTAKVGTVSLNVKPTSKLGVAIRKRAGIKVATSRGKSGRGRVKSTENTQAAIQARKQAEKNARVEKQAQQRMEKQMAKAGRGGGFQGVPSEGRNAVITGGRRGLTAGAQSVAELKAENDARLRPRGKTSGATRPTTRANRGKESIPVHRDSGASAAPKARVDKATMTRRAKQLIAQQRAQRNVARLTPTSAVMTPFRPL